MEPEAPKADASVSGKLKIYFLPNLLTAGNLFCGFLALTKIVEANPASPDFSSLIRHALVFILVACIFDLLDGRVARMGGYESPFGREFDSLADIVSFGAAPAFLVHRVVLHDIFKGYPQLSWFIASIYLICGAFRLARFNCLATMEMKDNGKEFVGFPIPMAAGLVASLTLFILWRDDRGFAASNWRYMLPGIMLFLSFMMVSEVRYPSFKSLDWRARRTFPKMLVIILIAGFFIIFWEKVLQPVLPFFFIAYLLYGFVRPRLSRKLREEIEEEAEEEGKAPSGNV
jgi:CDP-diacylglycerol--serine O-phosphatidyltransferase